MSGPFHDAVCLAGGPRRALIDPDAQETDFVGRQPRALGGHHDPFAVEAGREQHDPAGIALSGHEGRPTPAAGKRVGPLIEPEPSLLDVRPVTTMAPLAQKRFDVGGEVDFAMYRGCGRSPGRHGAGNVLSAGRLDRSGLPDRQ